ncbi:MAG: tetratricopeptide repeat protein [Sphingomicrobium sp.]
MAATHRYLPVAFAIVLGLSAGPALAQGVVSPEQRIERLEKQLRQVQRQIFPKGQPADSAGFSDEPAATQSSFRTLDARLGALERQLADVLRQSEENGHRVAVMETDLARLRSDQEARMSALERAAVTGSPVQVAGPSPGPGAAPSIAPSTTPATEAAVVPTLQKPPASQPPATGKSAPTAAAAVPANDPAELAYDEGYQLWRAGKHDEAIVSLRAFVSAYPKNRRTSWANNLIGRALLDKGEPRAAAEALLANYRSDAKGERAPDSLYYLGQALMQLNQAGQACKAYSELEAVYGDKMRAELKSLLPAAKSDAHCN